MAIIPITMYAGQVVSASGYPHGKARNEVVEGDGSGTPLEEAWLNDVWGFLQALLDDADITPDGLPDEVGASQYLDAINAVILNQVNQASANANFLGDAYTWTGIHRFTAAARLDAPCISSASSELFYADTSGAPALRTRTIMLPLDQGAPAGGSATTLPDDNEGWSTTAGTMFVNASAVYNERRWSFRLPHGAVLTRVTAGVHLPAGGDVFEMNVRRIRANLVSPYMPTVTVLATDAEPGANAGHLMDSGVLATTVDGALDTFAVDMLPSAIAQSVRYIAVEFSDPGPRNF